MQLVRVQIVFGADKRPLLWNIGPVSDQKFSQGPLGVRFMLQLTDTQQVKISIVAVDKKGAPATAQSASFSSSDPNIAMVTQDTADPNAALVVAGLPGSCAIHASATAPDGSSVSGTLDLTVVGGQVASLTISAATPEEQPAS